MTCLIHGFRQYSTDAEGQRDPEGPANLIGAQHAWVVPPQH